MQVNINTLSDVEFEADIELSSDELQPHFEAAYARYRPKAEVKGFRKGKVPMAMIKRLYGDAIEHDALDDIAGEFYRKAMDEKSIRPLGQPALVDMDFKKGQYFRFKIKYEVKPAIELRKYTGIELEKPIHVVTDAEVQAELEHLQRANSTTSQVQTVTDRNHVVIADLQELDDAGTPLIGKKTTGNRIQLFDPTLVPELKEALGAAEVGGEYRVNFTSEHDQHSHSTHLLVKVTGIEKGELPPFDETLVRKLTGDKISTTDEFLRKLRADLGRYWEDQSNKRLRDALAAEIVRLHEFTVPATMVEGILDSLIDEVRANSRDRKLPKNFDEKNFREENRAYAIWQAKWILLKEQIAEAEHISVSDEEVEKLAEADASRLGIAKDRMIQYYKSSDGTKDRLLTEKITAFLLDRAKITERIVEEPVAK